MKPEEKFALRIDRLHNQDHGQRNTTRWLWRWYDERQYSIIDRHNKNEGQCVQLGACWCYHSGHHLFRKHPDHSGHKIKQKTTELHIEYVRIIVGSIRSCSGINITLSFGILYGSWYWRQCVDVLDEIFSHYHGLYGVDLEFNIHCHRSIRCNRLSVTLCQVRVLDETFYSKFNFVFVILISFILSITPMLNTIIFNQFPIRYISRKVATCLISIGWIIGVTIGLIPMFWNNWDTATECEFDEILPPWYMAGVITPIFSTVWIFMLLLYVRICREAAKHVKLLRSSFSGSNDSWSDWKSVQVSTEEVNCLLNSFRTLNCTRCAKCTKCTNYIKLGFPDFSS